VSKVDLRIDWATHDAAKYACENWHYSKSIPVPPLVKVGVWEKGKFIGVVIFSRGASSNLMAPYGLTQDQGCELTRIALRAHDSPVSRIAKLAMQFLKRNSPDLRLIVSFADPQYGHHGGIYQACGFAYVGATAPGHIGFDCPDGSFVHGRICNSRFGTRSVDAVAKIKPDWSPVYGKPKHLYIFPLRQKWVTISRKHGWQSLPYPKPHAARLLDDQGSPLNEAGANPAGRSNSPGDDLFLEGAA